MFAIEIVAGEEECEELTSRKRSAGDEPTVVSEEHLAGFKVINGKKKNSKNQDENDAEVINTSAGTVIVEDDVEINPEERTSQHKRTIEKRLSIDNGKTKKSKPLKQKKINNQSSAIEKNSEDKELTDAVDETAMDTDGFDATEWLKLGVPDVVIRALREKNFNKPTTIQVSLIVFLTEFKIKLDIFSAFQTLTLPAAILGRKDIVGAAETGSGKTLAFAIPIIDGILKLTKGSQNADKGNLKALILTPTRELAVQIKNHIDVAAKFTRIKVLNDTN